jgi:hypothetical protein
VGRGRHQGDGGGLDDAHFARKERQGVQYTRTEYMQKLWDEILSENAAMVAVAKHFHFHFVRDEDLRSMTARLALS